MPATLESSPQLRRVLGPWMATALLIGTVIGSGVFKKPQAVAAAVPEFGLAIGAWVLIGVLTLLGSLALAEVAVLLPRAGGNYVFLREAYGRCMGFLWGWVEFWVIRTASIAALATIFTDSLHDILREARGLTGDAAALGFWERQAATIAVIAVLALINARGTTWGGGLQLAITVVKVATLVAIALLPFVLYGLAAPAAVEVRSDRLAPVWPRTWAGIDWSQFGAALVGVLWAYHGWMNIAPVAEEVHNPQRNIPLALVAGTLTIMGVYVFANVAYYLVVPREVMIAGPRIVASEFAFRLLGPAGMLLASGAIMISVFGALNGNMLVGPRLLFAMGRDKLAPPWLSRLHAAWNTPVPATAVLAGWSIILVVGASLLVQYRLPVWRLGPWHINPNLPPGARLFDVLTDYAIFGATSFETMAVAALFLLRRRSRDQTVPYRCPLFPWVPLIYVAAMAAVLANMFVAKRTESLFATGFIAVGALCYALVFSRKEAFGARGSR